MKVPITMALAAAAAVSVPAHADFSTALSDYRAGRYDVARGEFLALAELGDCSSQFNLAAMALKGQGGPADTASGVGWMQAAAGNGCQQLVGNRLEGLQARLDAAQSGAAAQILARYGPEALRSAGVIDPPLSCSDMTAVGVASAVEPEYPANAGAGIAVVAMTIGADGLARDPEILLSAPDESFAVKAVEAWFNTRFVAAARGGQALASRVQLKHLFTLAGAPPLAELDTFRKARAAADAGNAAGEYLVGVAASPEGAFGITGLGAAQLVLAAARDGDAQAQYWIGSQQRATAACHPRADGSVWLRHAAAGGSAAAQLAVARELLQGAAGGEQLAQARALLAQAAGADSYYVRKHVAALLATVAAVRDAPLAQRIARKLAEGPLQSDPEMFEVVAAAAAANGQYGEAVAQQQLALTKGRRLGWNTDAMSTRLASYRGGRAWNGELLAP